MPKARKGLRRGAYGSVPQCSILRAHERAQRARAKGKESESRRRAPEQRSPCLRPPLLPLPVTPLREMRPGARHTETSREKQNKERREAAL